MYISIHKRNFVLKLLLKLHISNINFESESRIESSYKEKTNRSFFKMASADSGKSSSSTGDFPEKPHQPRSIKFPMRDIGKQKRAFNPKWFDQFTFFHYRKDSDSVIWHTCALADKGYTVTISGVFLLPCRMRMRTFVILIHFKASEMAKSLELPGAPATWTPARALPWNRWVPCSAPRPPAVLGNDLRSLR